MALSKAGLQSILCRHPASTSFHSSHTAPGRGSRHPFHATSRARQPDHAPPDCHRAHRGNLRTGRIRRVRAGCAEPQPGRPGARARSSELITHPADLGPRARDRRCPDDRVARTGGPPARLRLPRRAPLRHRAAARWPSREWRCIGSASHVPATVHTDTEPIRIGKAKPDPDSDGEALDPSLADADTALIQPFARSAPPRAVSSESGVEQWKLVGLITRRSSVRIRPPQFLSPADCLAV